MPKALRGRFWIIVASLVGGALCLVPTLAGEMPPWWNKLVPVQKLRLGLDLKGGVHLVLRVQTDDALNVETEQNMERLRDELARRNIAVTVARETPTRFRLTGVPAAQDAEFRAIADEQVSALYTRESGAGGSYAFEMKANEAVRAREQTVQQALQTIERRVNEFGVAEPIVAPHGTSGDQILVQLPGVTDVARTKELIRSTALLELKLVEQGPAPSKEALLQGSGGQLPANMEVVSGIDDRGITGQAGGTIYYLVRRAATVTGRDLRNALPSLGEQPARRALLAERGRRAEVRPGHGRERRAAAGDHPRRPRAVETLL